MRRREVIAGLALGVAMGRARAQQGGRVYRIAIVHPARPVEQMTETGILYFQILFRDLRKQGFVEGQNLVVDRYNADGRVDRYPEIVSRVVGSNPDLIFTYTIALTRLFKVATTRIPIVCSVNDPVANGLVTSLSHPGGNITGTAFDTGLELYGKYAQLLQEAMSGFSRIGVLIARNSWEQADTIAFRRAAEKLGAVVVDPMLENYQEPDYRRAFTRFKDERADSLFVASTTANFVYANLIVGLAAQFALPAIYTDRSFASAGGLISYGFDIPDQYRIYASYIGKILKGANPGDLPFVQPTKLELVINLNTANALGLTIPPLLIASADEVIE